jgi:hypothetical protein
VKAGHKQSSANTNFQGTTTINHFERISVRRVSGGEYERRGTVPKDSVTDWGSTLC